MFAANVIVICPTLISATPFGDTMTMHLVGNNSSMKPTSLCGL